MPGPPEALIIISGDRQFGYSGRLLVQPLMVQVVDSGGHGIAGVWVDWTVASGAGELCAGAGSQGAQGAYCSSSLVTTTQADGSSLAWFRPSQMGSGSAVAAVAGSSLGPVTFSVEVSAVLIRFSPVFDCTGPNDPVLFRGPDNSSVVRVPVGTPVDWVFAAWVHPSCKAWVMSTSGPPGGGTFDHGDLWRDRVRVCPSSGRNLGVYGGLQRGNRNPDRLLATGLKVRAFAQDN